MADHEEEEIERPYGSRQNMSLSTVTTFRRGSRALGTTQSGPVSSFYSWMCLDLLT